MSPDIVANVAALFAKRTGFSTDASRVALVGDVFARLMLRHDLADGAAALAFLVASDAALDELVAELVTGETYFYRDPEQLDTLRLKVLPALVESRPAEHVVRVWSAGCATGEEPYTLAMLFEDQGLAGRTSFLATDISRPSLVRAERGIYGTWSLRALTATQRARWFTTRGNDHLLLERIRRRVTFAYLNLAQEPFPSAATGTQGLDLVVCRNVLMYFAPPTRARVSRRLVASLAEEGWLVLGAADRLLDVDDSVETVVTTSGSLYRRRRRRAAARAPVVFALPAATAAAAAAAPPPAEAPPSPSTLDEARAALDAGDYAGALRVAATFPEDSAASAVHVSAIANLHGAAPAADACAEALRRHPLSIELLQLHAAALVGAGHVVGAISALRKVLYLDPRCAVAHLLLASVLLARGDAQGSARALRNALKLEPASADPPYG